MEKRLTIRTKPPEFYMEPDEYDIQQMAKRVGLKGKPAFDIAADVTNIEAGGDFEQPSSVLENVRYEAASKMYYDQIQKKWYAGKFVHADRDQVEKTYIDKRFSYHSNAVMFVSQLDRKKVPGNSPLERAVATLKLMQDNMDEDGRPDQNGNVPSFADNKEGMQKKIQEMNDLLNDASKLTAEELEIIDPGEEIKNEPDKFLKQLKALELLRTEDNRLKIKTNRMLEKITDLNTYHFSKEEPDPEGENARYRPIKDIAEIPAAAAEDMGLYMMAPAVFFQFAEDGNINVREKTNFKEKKQAIAIICDGSGSMVGTRHKKAAGIVFNRINAVMKGHIELWLYVFNHGLIKVGYAQDITQAKVLYEKFDRGGLPGGGTNIPNAIRGAFGDIRDIMKSPQGAHLIKPEIWVITDEDGSASGLTKSDILGFKVHGFAMESDNSFLSQFCKKTGGIYLSDL